MLKTKRGGLGRGFESLLGEAARDVIAQPEFEALKQIDAAKIRPGIYQPRKVFHDDTLQELAQSIAEHGILQPLVVRPVADSQYEIIAGERRFRASQIAGLTKIPCVVKNYSDQQALAVALIENLQRSDLNILEVASALQQLVQDFNLTHEKAAQRAPNRGAGKTTANHARPTAVTQTARRQYRRAGRTSRQLPRLPRRHPRQRQRAGQGGTQIQQPRRTGRHPRQMGL